MTLFCLIVISVAIPGIVFASGISDGLKSTRCSFFAALGDLMLQKPGTVWPGLYVLAGRVSKLSD
jgi:hypothetical protein